MKDRLDAAARLSGRSQTQEIELRLEQSFDRQDLLFESLANAFGEQGAALLVLLGNVLKDVAGVTRAAPLLARGGLGKQVVIDFSGAAWFEGWLEDPVAYHEAAKAIARVLEELRPTGSTTLPQSVLDGLQTQGFDTIGERVAKDRLLLLTDVTGDERGKRLRKALGTLAAKLRKENLR